MRILHAFIFSGKHAGGTGLNYKIAKAQKAGLSQ